MKLTKIEKSEARIIGQKALEALRAVAQELGMTVAPRGGNFSATSALLKFEFSLIGENGTVLTREAEHFQSMAGYFGLTPEHLGATFHSRGQLYRITGWSTSRSRMPIYAQRADGKPFRFSIDTVKAALGVA